MEVFSTVRPWREKQKQLQNKSLGFVPTMGALHPGHLSLVKASQKQNQFTLVSIFVNPTQFDNPQDLQNYPQLLEKDLAQLEELGVDFVFAPKNEDLYSDNYRYQVSESQLSKELCGAHRPGHFTGMLTVVMKLLNIAQATNAYFGEKDYQQYLLIKGMSEAFFLSTNIIPCPLVRETDGLAMSSRNARLSKEDRARAPKLFQALTQSANAEIAQNTLRQQGFDVDYVAEMDGRRLAAASLGTTRLIDNVKI